MAEENDEDEQSFIDDDEDDDIDDLESNVCPPENAASSAYKKGPFDPMDQSNYPEWSWDHVRSYVAIRKKYQYSDDQIQQIANHDVVMLEKCNGSADYGSTEEGSLQAAKRIKKVNPRVKILFYLNSMVHYGGYLSNDSFQAEAWATRKKNNPKQLFKLKDKYFYYDHRNLEFREWWIQRALGMLEHEEIDGIFIDAIAKTTHEGRSGKGHGEAYFATATELRERLPAGKILIGNALRARKRGEPGGFGHLNHLHYLDGSYLEGWHADPETIVQSMELMSAALREGRIIMLNAELFGPPNPEYKKPFKEVLRSTRSLDKRYELMKPMIKYPLAIFLLIVEPYAYLSYHYGVDASQRPGANAAFDCTRFEELKRKFGKAKGPYVKEEGDGEFVFSREFEFVKVWVNIKTKETRYEGVDGSEHGDEL